MKPARANSLGAVAALLLAIVAFLAINLAAGLSLGSVKLDLTQGRIYTLSPATVDLLKTLNEPITLRFYASPALTEASGQYTGYEQHVRALLDVYARHSHGRITVDDIAPEPYSAEEDRAFSFGLHGVPVDDEGNQAYFGIVATNSTDQTQTIPFLTPDREVFLEYDLTRLIASLGQPKKPVVGLIDGTGAGGMQGGDQGKPWVSLEQARTLFTIRRIDQLTSTIDPAIPVLLIVHPKDLSPITQFAIDQYVLGGGHALVFVDPDAESVAAPMSEMMSSGTPGGGASDLPALFKAWGIDYDPHKIVADWGQSMRVEGESFDRPIVTQFPPYIEIKPPHLDPDDPVTGDLKVINMVTVGALLQAQDAKTTMTPLITSSAHSALANAEDAVGNADPLAFLSKYKQGDQNFVMAARIVGPANTAFPNGPPKDSKIAADKILKTALKPVDVIVVADVDMLANHTWVDIRDMMGQQVAAPFASNGDFLVNALENLTGSPALATLRGRGISSRPLTRIEDLQRVADEKYRATKDELSKKLDEARRKLLSLAPAKSADSDSAAPVLNEEQQATVKQFRAEMADTRNQLRDVQHNLRRDIEQLEGEIEFANIVLVPLAVVIFALLLAFGGRRRGR